VPLEVAPRRSPEAEASWARLHRRVPRARKRPRRLSRRIQCLRLPAQASWARSSARFGIDRERIRARPVVRAPAAAPRPSLGEKRRAKARRRRRPRGRRPLVLLDDRPGRARARRRRRPRGRRPRGRRPRGRRPEAQHEQPRAGARHARAPQNTSLSEDRQAPLADRGRVAP
jgi:hypothetical protein